MNRRLLISIVSVLVALCVCLAAAGAGFFIYQRLGSPPAALPETAVDLTGHMVIGFEVASFVPCALGDDPGDGQGYWLSADPGVQLYDAYHAATGDDYTPAYVHLRGRLSPEGEYGHLGGYTRELTVTEIIEINVTGQCAP